MRARKSPTELERRREAAVLDAMRMLEASLRAVLGPEVLFVLVTAHPKLGTLEVYRASNCDRVACDLLQIAVKLPANAKPLATTLRQ